MFWFSGPEVCGVLAHWPGIKPAPPALEGEVLTTGLPGKSQKHGFLTTVPPGKSPTYVCFKIKFIEV